MLFDTLDEALVDAALILPEIAPSVGLVIIYDHHGYYPVMCLHEPGSKATLADTDFVVEIANQLKNKVVAVFATIR